MGAGDVDETEAMVPIIRAAGEGDKRSFFGGGMHTWKLLAEDTGGAFYLMEDAMAQGKSTPWHRHPDADETLYILEGEILINVDGQESRLAQGGMSFVPRGVPHAFVVVSDGARLLVIQTPGAGQAFYRGASVPATDDNAADVVDIARLQASAKENAGVEMLGPPPFATSVAG
jgi:quercetin dioxygenase-like cupin family protein